MSYGTRKEFYNSTLWKKVRLNVWRKQSCLCYICKKPVYVNKLSEWIPKEKRRRGIVHHKIFLTEENIFDESIALDESNLVGVCKDCHEHQCHNLNRSTREGLTFDENGNLIQKEKML